MNTLAEKYDDLIESVSVWYRFFREGGTEPGPATSRVLDQLHFMTSENEYLLLLAYLLLVEEVLAEQSPDEETVQYLFDNVFEDFKKDNLKFTFRMIVGQLSQDQRADLLNHLETIQTCGSISACTARHARSKRTGAHLK